MRVLLLAVGSLRPLVRIGFSLHPRVGSICFQSDFIIHYIRDQDLERW